MTRQKPRGNEEAGQLRLLHAITVIANEAPSAEWAMERSIERICSDGGWSVGHVYLEVRDEPGVYRDQGIWWLESPEAVRPFVRVSAGTLFRPGVGFVGGVIASAGARHLRDMQEQTRIPRVDEARACGIRSGLAFPIMVESRVAGVMEFFSTRRRRITRSWLDTYTQMGTELGRIVERKELEREIADLAAREQQRLGQEIHDTLGQQVTALEMLLKSYLRRCPARSGEEESATRLVKLAEDAKRQVRALSRGLVPVEVESGGLDAALEDLARQTSELHGIRCSFRCEQRIEPGGGFAASQLYRIAREGVHNAVKHGKPGRIDIVLREKDGLVTLQIRDDGRGPAGSPGNGAGRGLKIMSYRAHSIGGTVRLVERPGGGALLNCSVRSRSLRSRPVERAS